MKSNLSHLCKRRLRVFLPLGVSSATLLNIKPFFILCVAVYSFLLLSIFILFIYLFELSFYLSSSLCTFIFVAAFFWCHLSNNSSSHPTQQHDKRSIREQQQQQQQQEMRSPTSTVHVQKNDYEYRESYHPPASTASSSSTFLM